ncbi:hypothetical protein AD006_29630 (plasmid) [Pseudonocardia sp. EC080610-09]|nr:hypothetical protein AD006_29630 [Pseudonocardia sp. EC080610-09]ALL85619.1 hypothetical protein AD017_31620 [Pseudonocardia sp. EC080619-01]
MTSTRLFTATSRGLREATTGVRVSLDDGEKAAGRYERTLRRVVGGARSVGQGFAAVRNAVRGFGNDIDTSNGRIERSFARVRSVGRGVATDLRTGFRGVSGALSSVGGALSGIGSAMAGAATQAVGLGGAPIRHAERVNAQEFAAVTARYGFREACQSGQ